MGSTTVTQAGNASTSIDASASLVISSLSSTTTLGDSILSYGMVAAGAVGGAYSNSHIAWANSLIAQGGVGFDVVSMRAVGGATLQNIIDNQLPGALTDLTEVAWLHGGINDLATTGGSSISAMMTKFTTIISQLAAAKKLVIVDSLNPLYQSGSTGAKTRAFQIPTVNASLEALCNQYSNVIYNDTYSALVDTTSAVLDAKANMLRTDDGIHFVTAGAQVAGYATVKNINNRIKLTKYKTKGSNLLTSAFSGSGGSVSTNYPAGITGTPPSGWQLKVTSTGNGVTGQTVAISSLSPDMIRLVCANTSATNDFEFQLNLLSNTAMNASLAAGDVVQAGYGFQAQNMADIKWLGGDIRRNLAQLHYMMYKSNNESTPATFPANAFGGFIKTPPYTIPEGAITHFEFEMKFGLLVNTGTLTIDIYAPELVKLS
jgi:lysophospholipase L1-like esterase